MCTSLRDWLLTPEQDIELLLLFAFIPARYDAHRARAARCPAGSARQIWTFVTYAFLHGDWTHLGFNGCGCLPSARRLRAASAPLRFLVFFAVTAAAGAPAHLAIHSGDARADGRRLGGDLGLHGGRDPLCVPARRSAAPDRQR